MLRKRVRRSSVDGARPSNASLGLKLRLAKVNNIDPGWQDSPQTSTSSSSRSHLRVWPAVRNSMLKDAPWRLEKASKDASATSKREVCLRPAVEIVSASFGRSRSTRRRLPEPRQAVRSDVVAPPRVQAASTEVALAVTAALGRDNKGDAATNSKPLAKARPRPPKQSQPKLPPEQKPKERKKRHRTSRPGVLAEVSLSSEEECSEEEVAAPVQPNAPDDVSTSDKNKPPTIEVVLIESDEEQHVPEVHSLGWQEQCHGDSQLANYSSNAPSQEVVNESSGNVAVVEEMVVWRCPDCHLLLEWSDYRDGSYAAGWCCNNSGAGCPGNLVSSGKWRWFCKSCYNDFCAECLSNPLEETSGSLHQESHPVEETKPAPKAMPKEKASPKAQASVRPKQKARPKSKSSAPKAEVNATKPCAALWDAIIQIEQQVQELEEAESSQQVELISSMLDQSEAALDTLPIVSLANATDDNPMDEGSAIELIEEDDLQESFLQEQLRRQLGFYDDQPTEVPTVEELFVVDTGGE